MNVIKDKSEIRTSVIGSASAKVVRLGTVVNELVKAFIDEVVKRRFKGLHHRKEGSTETVDENEPLEEELEKVTTVDVD